MGVSQISGKKTTDNGYNNHSVRGSLQTSIVFQGVVLVRLRPLPPMLPNIVLTALQVCEGTESHGEGLCKSCGGTQSGYDTRTKRFAILCDDEDDHTVEVFLHRSYCLT